MMFPTTFTPFLFLSTIYARSITTDTPLIFELRHLHAVSSSAHVSFADVPYQALSSLAHDEPYPIHTSVISTHRPPPSISPLHLIDERRRRAQTQRPFGLAQSFPEEHADWWDEDEVLGPDISRRSVLQLLAKMTNNAYLSPNETGWYDLGSNWTAVRAVLFLTDPLR
jgi:lipase ATG15